MAITQLSAFLENKPGVLLEALTALKEAGVNLRALSVADSKDFGILRLIVSDVEKTRDIFGENIIVKDTPVIAVRMDDQTGALSSVLAILRDAGVNIEYVYAFTGAMQGSAYVVLRVDDIEGAESILSQKGIKTLNDEDMRGFLS
ncbi:MAG: ACT domain-containing protein [Lachnospiraceae bacterium]|nr:ACT domain-containing protein [Lachnospiraceae bacterium]